MVSFKLFNDFWVWGRKRAVVSGDTPHFTSYLTIPYFSHPPYILFIKIKSIVAVGLCCILRERMNDYNCASLGNFSNVALTISKKKKLSFKGENTFSSTD